MRALTAFLVSILAISTVPADAETVVRYGISMADIPLTTGQPDRGAGAYQFTGYTIYDPLIAWDMGVADRPGKLVPGLATEWNVDAGQNQMAVQLRKGVKFHDGSDFNADAVIWNLDKVLNDKAPQFDKRQSAQVRPACPRSLATPRSTMTRSRSRPRPSTRSFRTRCSGSSCRAPRNMKSSARIGTNSRAPSGTGPFKLTSWCRASSRSFQRTLTIGTKRGLPKVDSIVLVPMPEALTRTNALLAGQVDLIETPAPDAVPQLKAAGMRIVDNITPHVWNYHFSVLPGSPWTDIRLRKALNLAIDRDGVVGLMNGLAKPAKGLVDPSSPGSASRPSTSSTIRRPRRSSSRKPATRRKNR